MLVFDQAMYAVLSGDAGLNVAAPGGTWRRLAPLDTLTPFTVFRQIENQDKYTFAGLAWKWLDYEVAVVDINESPEPALNAMALADALIQEQAASLVMTGWTVSQVRRTQQSDGHFVDAGGRLWQTVATQYRVMVVPDA